MNLAYSLHNVYLVYATSKFRKIMYAQNHCGVHLICTCSKFEAARSSFVVLCWHLTCDV
jgi:hypothetical protein